jgi:deazaflavin-dependent oxidoreductase (nitroreductase family)
MIEYTGRVTGARRYAVLELIEHRRPAASVVAAGSGDSAQWLRNVRANHRVPLHRGSRRPAAAIARELGPAEARAVLDRYAARHPRSWAMLAVVLGRTLGQPGDDGTPLPPVITFDVSPGG